MQMRTGDRKQRYGVKDTSTLQSSVDASKATANMYDQLTSSALRFSDVATTNAINSEIRDSKLSGEMEGVAGSEIGTAETEKAGGLKLGEVKGYENKSEIFKWDVASNQSAKTSFEANVNSRTSSGMKTLSADVNGDTTTYKNVAGQMMKDAVSGIEDPQQKQFVTNSYLKSYNQNLHTVQKTGIKIAGKQAKEGWEGGRPTFEEDYSVVFSSLLRDNKEYDKAMREGDYEKADKLIESMDKKKAELKDYKTVRVSKANGGIQLGTIAPETAESDTRTDIMKATASSFVEMYRNADSEEEKDKLRYEISRKTDDKESFGYLTPKYKSELLDALDTEELREQKMWNSSKSRDDKEYNISKRESVEEIQTSIITDPEKAVDNITTAFKAGYISMSERNAYMDNAINGSPVVKDNWVAYSTITSNIEDYSVAKIAGMNNLTDSTKRKFIGERLKWEEEGLDWMTAPDYKEGKNVIGEIYGYPTSSPMPDFISGAKMGKYVEMQGIVQEYRDEVRASVAKGERGNGVAIAERLIKKQKSDITSKIRNMYKEEKVIKKADVDDEIKETGKSVIEIMKLQAEKFPESKVDPKLEESMEEPPKTVKEGSWVPFSEGDDIPNPEWEKWDKRMNKGASSAEIEKQKLEDELIAEALSIPALKY